MGPARPLDFLVELATNCTARPSNCILKILIFFFSINQSLNNLRLHLCENDEKSTTNVVNSGHL